MAKNCRDCKFYKEKSGFFSSTSWCTKRNKVVSMNDYSCDDFEKAIVESWGMVHKCRECIFWDETSSWSGKCLKEHWSAEPDKDACWDFKKR